MLHYQTRENEGFNPILPVVKAFGGKLWLFRERKLDYARATTNIIFHVAFLYLSLLFVFSLESSTQDETNKTLVVLALTAFSWNFVQLIVSTITRESFQAGNDVHPIGCKKYIFLAEWISLYFSLAFFFVVIATTTTIVWLKIVTAGASMFLSIIGFIPIIVISRYKLDEYKT